MKVKDMMTKNPIVVELPGTRTEALRIMVKNNKTGVPVIKSRDETLVGVVTRHDIFAKPEEEQLALLVRKDYPTITKNSSIETAAKLLYENDIHHLPIVENKKLIGIVTAADVLSYVEKMKLKNPVENYVRSPCVPVFKSTPLAVALEITKICKVYALPVLNKNAALVGIVTDRDLFNISTINGTVAISDLGLGEDEDSWTWEGLRSIMKLYYEVSKINMPDIPVEKIMVKNPTTVFRKTGISEAARIMRKNDFGQLPIRDSKDHLLAMIYELDIMRAVLE